MIHYTEHTSPAPPISCPIFPNTSTQFGSTDMGEVFAVTVGKDILSKSNPIKINQSISLDQTYNVHEHLINHFENPA